MGTEFPFVVSYDSQGYGGGILTRLLASYKKLQSGSLRILSSDGLNGKVALQTWSQRRMREVTFLATVILYHRQKTFGEVQRAYKFVMLWGFILFITCSLVGGYQSLRGIYCLCPGLEIWEHVRRDPSRWPRGTLYQQKLELTSLTSCGRSADIVHLRTQAMEFFIYTASYL
jgi:hypothetical protein